MLYRSLGVSTLLFCVLAASCGEAGDKLPPLDRSDRSDRSDEEGVTSSVAHTDPRVGAPSFVWLSARGGAFEHANAAVAATHLLPSLTRAFAVDATASASVTLAGVDDQGKGPVVARFTQQIGDVEVFRGGANVVLTRALQPIAAAGFLAPTARGSDRPFTIATSEALAVGASRLGLSSPLAEIAGKDGYARFSGPGLLSPARVKKVFFPVRGAEGAELEPAYYVELVLASGPARSWVVAASDGRVLLENDLVRFDAFSYRVYADPVTKVPTDGPQGNGFAPHPSGTADKRKLEFSPSQTVTLQNFPFSKNDPWLDPGATTTAGNNVVAYADREGPNGFYDGTDTKPALTGAKAFLHAYDTAAAPGATPAAIQASATNLFYLTNFLHDWFYDAGFDEKSGNHQISNFDRGGKGGDALVAESQDYSGRNNANAMVPPDGSPPRIQMFVFSGASSASLVVTAPSTIAGTKQVGIASGFGKDIFDLSGNVVLAAGGAGADLADGCEPLENDVTGKIVLMHRGTCSFAQKAAIAQEGGAIGAIIANVAGSVNPAVAPFMGGEQSGITIPVLSLSLGDGQALEGAIASAPTVTMKRFLGSDLDGALDTSIVAHEWGHVLSGRLIGNGTGLTTNQSGGLGEGWGDFTALLLTTRADDPGNFGGTYSTGVYAKSGSGDDIYFGTRRVPYSIDFKKNALTLKHIQNATPLPADVVTSFGEDGSFNAEVHNTGEVWATMLWECYAALLRDRGLPFAEAQDRMKRYLVASLKLTPPDPTIIEARDAVLAAALAADPMDFQLFWKAFARRGAGAGALGPPKDSPSNQGVVESYESGNDLQIVEAKLADDVISCDHDGILDEGEEGSIEITVRNTGSGALASPSAQLLAKSADVAVVDPLTTVLPALAPFASAKVKLKAKVHAMQRGEPIELDVAVTDPSLPAARVVHLSLATRYDADQMAESSAIDHVDTTRTVWKTAGEGGEKWSRSSSTSDGYWMVPDPPRAADQTLVSPAFTIDGTSFALAFKHKWNFRRSARRNVDINGGVIEITVDGGKTWTDLSDFGKVDYKSTLDATATNDNPLKGRKAYGGKSQGFPNTWVTTRIDVAFPEHPESVQLRFRSGAATTRSGADGWFIDDIELGGITGTPFWSYVPHADACDPNGPTVNAGAAQRAAPRAAVALTGSATHPANKPLTFVWTQIAGPAVILADPTSLTPSFVAPDVSAATTITLVLRAHDGALLSAASKVDVVVDPSAAAADTGGCGCRTTPSRTSLGWIAGGLVALAALAFRRRRVR